MIPLRTPPEDEEDRRRRQPSITQALDMWSAWHCDWSPLGATGNYTLDMQLGDAFRHLLYRPVLGDRLSWIERQLRRPRRRGLDDRYQAELMKWWLDLFEAEKLPLIDQRSKARSPQCALS
ncbi:hypothetical protein MesoLj131c_62340 [Mesorhizobium sp. 131-3-5]|uniref:hypothetical protein n=1 Tax=Mesorhizobium sp. 131-3-5 TaxID=2744520 RepID=UPI0019283F98|nr:hypothetical protein [Mesorhizobium sp. 131-3-5]BCH11976.1 hypothetical protein MesoLj131c_62340 [Mesorhizobium sp. 131-3-5]